MFPWTILAATDGEAAYPGEVSPGRLAAIRRVETTARGWVHSVSNPPTSSGWTWGTVNCRTAKTSWAEVLSTHVTADVLLIAPWDRGRTQRP